MDGSQTDMGAQAEAAAALSGGGAKTVAAAHSSSLPAAVNSVFASLEPVTGDGRVNDPWAVAMLLTPRALRPVWRLLAWLAPARAVRTLAVASERCLAHSRRLLAAARAAAKEPPPGGTTADGASPLSLFSLLTCNGIAAAVARHGSGAAALLSDDAIMSHCHTMLLAGVETTAAMIAFALHLLAQHPDAAARVRAEADATPAPVYEDVWGGRFAFTEAVLRETTRVLPPASLVMRCATADTTLGGVRIPTGTRVFGCLSASGRSAALFPQPHAFRGRGAGRGAEGAGPLVSRWRRRLRGQRRQEGEGCCEAGAQEQEG